MKIARLRFGTDPNRGLTGQTQICVYVLLEMYKSLYTRLKVKVHVYRLSVITLPAFNPDDRREQSSMRPPEITHKHDCSCEILSLTQ